jgi:hypothetical protein
MSELPEILRPREGLTSRERAAATKRALVCVAQAVGAEWRVLWALAVRESRGDYLAVHRLAGDVRGATKALQRNRDRLFSGNPYLDDESLWLVGRGPYGHTVPYHLHRWDPLASPMAMHSPWVAAVIALRAAASIVRSGAPTWAHVNQAWATGRWGIKTDVARERRERLRARLASMNLPAELADERPDLGSSGGWGRGPTPDQVARLEAVARACTGTDPPNEPPDPSRPSILPTIEGMTNPAIPILLVTATAAMATAAWWTMSRRPTKRITGA